MLAMHKHWLRNWSRALRLQSRLIRQQEQLKKRLQRRLNLLRKQLKKRRHPQRLVDKCFRRLAQAIKKWQKTTDYHQFIEGQEQIWEAEADEVRKYLSAIRGKRPRKYRRIRVSVDNDIGDFNEFWKNATDVMVKRLKKIPKLREDKSETQVYADSDSIASLSESLKKIINASRPRKSIRKSIHGPLVPPKQLRIAPPKEKVDSHYQTLKKDIMYIRANDSDAARSKKFRRLSTRRSLSVPLMSSQKQRLLLKKSVSDTFITKSRPPFGKIIGEDLQDMGRPMDKSIPQAGDQLGLQIDENLNKTVAPRRDSIGYSTPTFPSKEKLRQLQEYNYEGLPEDFHRFFDNAHDTYNYERIVKSPEDEYGTEARDSRRQKDLKEYTPGRFLIKDLESDDKHKPLQTFLKDIIENNKFVEFGADVKGLMLVVGKHHMWNSLQLLHDDLMQSGFSRGEVKQMLSAKYMEYLSDIASGLQFAKIEAPRDIFLNFVETDPAKPKQMSQVDRLIAKNYWNKQRLSTRLIPFGMRGLKGTRSASPHSRRLSQDTRMDSAMYKKLMEQEMNAERLERENRKRRLFPTFSRIFGSFESAVSISSVNMAPDEEQDLRDSEMRYSLQNLNT
uniref:Uncharacterized protein LOC108038567 n=1 Tax=Drosophila rhopaloa TaxID=1041015 RepID=A0A6P4DZA1_DRORH